MRTAERAKQLYQLELQLEELEASASGRHSRSPALRSPSNSLSVPGGVLFPKLFATALTEAKLGTSAMRWRTVLASSRRPIRARVLANEASFWPATKFVAGSAGR
jgi:hypothetical protein